MQLQIPTLNGKNQWDSFIIPTPDEGVGFELNPNLVIDNHEYNRVVFEAYLAISRYRTENHWPAES